MQELAPRVSRVQNPASHPRRGFSASARESVSRSNLADDALSLLVAARPATQGQVSGRWARDLIAFALHQKLHAGAKRGSLWLRSEVLTAFANSGNGLDIISGWTAAMRQTRKDVGPDHSLAGPSRPVLRLDRSVWAGMAALTGKIVMLVAGVMLIHTPLARAEGAAVVIAVGEPGSASYKIGLGLASLLRTVASADGTALRAEVWESLEPTDRIVALLEDAQFAVISADDQMLGDPRAQEKVRVLVGLADGNQIIVGAELDEAFAYEMMERIFEDSDFSSLLDEESGDLGVDTLDERDNVAVHPGALRFYREYGKDHSDPGEVDAVGDRSDSAKDSANALEPPGNQADPMSLEAVISLITEGLRKTRAEAMARQEEQVFVIDVEKRLFATSSAGAFVPLDTALEIRLYTAKSELIDVRRGGIRFFPNGSSTGGRIALGHSGDEAAVEVHWADGAVKAVAHGRSRTAVNSPSTNAGN